MLKNFRKEKKGVFGLTAIQQFFVVILGLALLAYVIVIILGTLNTSQILSLSSDSVTNESITMNTTVPGVLAYSGVLGFSNPQIVKITSTSGAIVFGANTNSNTNYSLSSTGVITALLDMNATKVTYTYYAAGTAGNQLNNILLNTSNGVAGFFGSINPVYAILAVLVIILVLVVLVRVVSGGGGMGGSREASVPL
jgi:hypothetical protein